MIRGIGVDTVDIARFERQLARTPRLLERLFTPGERGLPAHSLAARFAAKEALVKALGGSDGVGFQDLEVARGESRAPSFAATERLVAALRARGADRAHLSMTHDGGLATAFVVIEGSILAGGASDARPHTAVPSQHNGTGEP